ncbi:MAG TPA: hypothetical protein VFB04_10555 [Terriglobales bacterium]|nr:hypothetical protein [Terriglobales bacterium]
MIEDHELNSWREQWVGVAETGIDVHRIHRKIRHQQVRFVVENVLAGVVFLGGLILALVVKRQESQIGTGWAAGVCALMVLELGYRLWLQRGTWRANTQSTHAFVELWRKRIMAKLRMILVGRYVALGWLVFCALLTAANWRSIGPEYKLHPAEWVVPLVGSVLLVPVIFGWTAWFRRHKLRELEEVNKILGEIDD